MNRVKYIWIIICAMATFFTFAMNKDAMNYISIGVMLIVPFLLLIQYPYFEKSDRIIYLLLLCIISSAAFHPESFRLSTILYSTMFIITFIYYRRLINNTQFNINDYLKIIKFLFWAFFITMLIQQFCAILGLPIFNYRVGDLSVFKVNSLASEPSYFGKIIIVLMMSYITIREIDLGRKYNFIVDCKKDKLIWGLFLYQIFFCGSSFAIALLAIFCFKFLKYKFIIPFSFIAIMIGFIVLNTDYIPIQRAVKLSQSIITLDEDKMFDADQSGAFRIAPTVRYFKELDLSDLNSWIGYGVDYTRFHLFSLSAAIDEDNGFSVGLFPAFLWDFGILTTLVLLVLVFKLAIASKLDFLLWLIIVLDAPFNTQLFWITLILMSTNKYLKQKYTNELNAVQKVQ